MTITLRRQKEKPNVGKPPDASRPQPPGETSSSPAQGSDRSGASSSPAQGSDRGASSSPAEGSDRGASSSPAEGSEARDAERFAVAWDEFLLAIRRGQAPGQQSADDLTLPQYYLLLPLEDGSAVPVCRLAECAGIAAPTATRFIDAFERDGMVRRERSQEDRRTVLVSLTPAGQKRLARKHSQLVARRRRLYEQLAPEEREQSERLLRHLAELIGHL
jgi:MarR family transcriptional regulator, organic hydroperoxide resistance regulator